MKSEQKTTRRKGQMQISISISKALVEKIDRAAVRERRNRSNFIACVLERVVDRADIPK